MNVYEKLNAAREEFHSLELKKTGHNKFAGYNYFELGDFLIPAMQVFKRHGLCAFVTFEKEVARMAIINVEEQDAMAPGKFILIESPMGSAQLKGCHEVQNIGAVETYQRRYLWVAALEIVEHDALDATTGKEEKPAAKALTKRAPPKTGVKADVLSQEAPLTKDETDYLDEMADEIIADAQNDVPISKVHDKIEETNLTVAQKVYLSALLPAALVTKLRAAAEEKHRVTA